MHCIAALCKLGVNLRSFPSRGSGEHWNHDWIGVVVKMFGCTFMVAIGLLVWVYHMYARAVP
eukprot:3951182-Amphidinium_carterae.1